MLPKHPRYRLRYTRMSSEETRCAPFPRFAKGPRKLRIRSFLLPLEIEPTALGSDFVFFHFRRNSLRYVSAVCERAAKTAHTLLPSSSPNQSRKRRALIWQTWGQKKLAALRFRLTAKTAHPLLPSSSRNRTHCVGLRFRFLGVNTAAANGTRSAAAAYVLIRSLLPRNCPSCRLSRHDRF